MRWRLLNSPPLGGARNMALDHALLDRARETGEQVVRVYSWDEPVLSLGRNQRALGIYKADALAAAGVGVVRRPTGGRALFHAREVTYSITGPAAASRGLRDMYAQVNELLVNALAALEIRATIADASGPVVRPGTSPCFAEPAGGEITVNGRKLAGSAQWRDDGAWLQHGSILIDNDQPRIATFMRDPAPPVPPPATLRECLQRYVAPAEFADTLFTTVRTVVDPGATLLSLDSQLASETDRLEDHYRNPEWTWRR